METLIHRIAQIAEAENISITLLEQQIGASKGVLSRAIQKGSDIRAKWLQKIAEGFPQYSCRWLLTGEGPMLKSGEAGNVGQQLTRDVSGDSMKTITMLLNKVLEQAEEIGKLKQLLAQYNPKSGEITTDVSSDAN